MSKKAAIYLRVSTIDQNYERQEMELKALVEFEGYELVYIFEEKKSAVLDMDTREELTKMRQLTKADVDKIYVWDITRLSRNSKDFVSLIEEFIEKGICLYFKNERLITLDDEGNVHPMTKLQLYILGVFAQMDVDNFKAKSKSGKERSLAIGNSYTYNAPYGYEIVDKRLYVKEDEAKTVRMFYEYYTQGKSLTEVEHILNANIEQNPTRKGHLWTKAMMFKMLMNPVYKGEPEYTNLIKDKNGKVVDKVTRVFKAPAIVDKAIWEKAQKQKELNKTYVDKGRERRALLRGLLICGSCGKPYNVAATGRGFINYLCSDRRASVNTKIGCKNGSMSVGYLDYICWEAIKDIYNYQNFKEKFVEEKERCQKNLEDNLLQIQHFIKLKLEQDKQIAKIRHGYKLGIYDDMSAVKDLEECNVAKNKYDRRISELEAENLVLKAKIEQDFSRYQIPDIEPSFDEKKTIFKDLIEEAKLYKCGTFRKIVQLTLKMGLSFNICYDGNRMVNKYFVVDDSTVTLSRLPENLKSVIPADIQSEIKDFTVTSNNNELFGSEVFGEYSFEELWKIMGEYGYLKKLPVLDKAQSFQIRKSKE